MVKSELMMKMKAEARICRGGGGGGKKRRAERGRRRTGRTKNGRRSQVAGGSENTLS